MILEVIDFDPEKIERKGGARFLAFSIYDLWKNAMVIKAEISHFLVFYNGSMNMEMLT